MNKLATAFQNGKALIPFITCGDPDLDTTYDIVLEMVKNGADLIELGIPFSDPTAEGPVIQAANLRALSAGTTTDQVFDLVRRLRNAVSVPMVFMTYANVVFSYGYEAGGESGQSDENPANGAVAYTSAASGTCHAAAVSLNTSRSAPDAAEAQKRAEILWRNTEKQFSGSEKFIKTCAEIGINGLILPDLPYEEKEEFSALCKESGIALISMIAPTSENRITMIAKEAEGFLYVVSSLGVTGTRTEIKSDIGAMTALIRKATDVPCAVGFGIADPETAARMASLSDGAIVGSAIVKLIAQYGKDAAKPVGAFVRSLKDALRKI